MPFYPPTKPATAAIKAVYREKAIPGYNGTSARGRLYLQTETGYPDTILDFPADRLGLHPTEKPIAMLKSLIELYTRPGDVVLDCCMGAGSCGVACGLSGRRFIGIERDAAFFDLARQAIEMVNAEGINPLPAA